MLYYYDVNNKVFIIYVNLKKQKTEEATVSVFLLGNKHRQRKIKNEKN